MRPSAARSARAVPALHLWSPSSESTKTDEHGTEIVGRSDQGDNRPQAIQPPVIPDLPVNCQNRIPAAEAWVASTGSGRWHSSSWCDRARLRRILDPLGIRPGINGMAGFGSHRMPSPRCLRRRREPPPARWRRRKEQPVRRLRGNAWPRLPASPVHPEAGARGGQGSRRPSARLQPGPPIRVGNARSKPVRDARLFDGFIGGRMRRGAMPSRAGVIACSVRHLQVRYSLEASLAGRTKTSGGKRR